MNKSQIDKVISCLNKAEIGDKLVFVERDIRNLHREDIGYAKETVIWGKSRATHPGLEGYQNIYHFVLSAPLTSFGMNTAELTSAGYKRYYDINFDLVHKSGNSIYVQLYDLTYMCPIKIIKQTR
jgi:hypothetical protein